MSKNIFNLKSFLQQYYINEKPNGSNYSHLALGGLWGGKWMIPDDQIDEFNKYYLEAITNGLKLCLSEVKTEVYNLFVDIDFDQETYSLLPSGCYLSILDFYKKAIEEVCQIESSNTYTQIISMREPWKIHINYYNLPVTNIISLKIRQIVLDKVITKYGTEHCDWNKAIDISIYKGSGLRLLGSVKPNSSSSYEIVEIITEDNMGIYREGPITIDDLKRTSIRLPKGSKPIETKINLDEDKEIKKLSFQNKNSKTICNLDNNIKETLDSIIDDNRHMFPQHDLKLVRYKKVESGIKNNTNEHYFVDTLDKYCPFIERDHTRQSPPIYMHITKDGLCLRCHDVDCVHKSYPKVPIPIDGKYMNTIFNIAQVNINAITNTNTTINNYCNSEDDDLEVEFDNDIKKLSIFTDKKLNKLLVNSLDGSDYSIGLLLYELMKDEYMLDLNDNWWIFRDHHWICSGEAYGNLSGFISTRFLFHYKKIRNIYRKDINNIEDSLQKSKKIDKIINNLKSLNFKKRIAESAGLECNVRSPKFLGNLDSNLHLIGFNNGVYDLEKDEFRDGKSEDMISFTVGYDYKYEYDEQKKKEILKFFEDIQPLEEDREYLLTYLSTLLMGSNPEELFHIFTGKTRNGKSKLRDLLSFTLGDYYSTFNSNLLTDNRPQSGSAQEDLMDLKGKRAIVGSEIDKKKKINTMMMKNLSGNDPIKGRKLFKSEFEYRPQFKILLLCNDIPEMDSTDGGVWSRLRVLNFPVTFVDRNPVGDFEKKMDKNLSIKIEGWKSDFMLLLLEYYGKYKINGLVPTKSINKATEKYRKNIDYFLNYLKERIIKTDNLDDLISLGDLYGDFINWYKMNYPGIKIPNKSVFKSEIIKHGHIVKHIRLKDNKGFIRGIQNYKIVNNCKL